MMKRWIIVPALMACLFTFTQGNRGTAHPSQASSAQVESGLERLNRIANDPLQSRDKRAAAIFALFRDHLKNGDGLEKVKRVLRCTDWLEESEVSHIAFLGGFIPVELKPEQDRTYALYLFPEETDSPKWWIYFRLKGKSERGKENEDGVAFLSGKVGSGGASRMVEFSLSYHARRNRQDE